MHQISRQYANRLIKAGKVRAEMVPIVSKLGLPMPDNEAQLRELARVATPQEREAVIVAAVEVVNGEEDGDGKLTARVIRQVVDARSSENGADTNPEPPPLTPGKRLVKAREKLEELESALKEGCDPMKALAALRRILVA